MVGLSSSFQDNTLAVVENSLSPMQHEESVVRLYDVGRSRADTEEAEADGGDNEEDGEDVDEVDSEGKVPAYFRYSWHVLFSKVSSLKTRTHTRCYLFVA